MKLHHLRPAPGSKKRRIRVGRGESGRRGKTAGRGTKGLKARGSVRPGFEGGQTPLIRQIPKMKGFKNPNREEYTVVNVEKLGAFDAGSTVTPDDLRSSGLAKKRGKIKVLGQGDIEVALTVKAHAFSAGAVDKITAAGGSVEVVES
jgi:large subunit ribosomal protein L15